jgi:hypothetical protein
LREREREEEEEEEEKSAISGSTLVTSGKNLVNL